jgi:alkylhydroperoxidase family enzyme
MLEGRSKAGARLAAVLYTLALMLFSCENRCCQIVDAHTKRARDPITIESARVMWLVYLHIDEGGEEIIGEGH